MANNCISSHQIFGDKEEIAKLYEKLSKLQQINSEYYQKYCKAKRTNCPLPEYPPEITETTPALWLGDIISYFGGDNTKVKCQGTMDTLELMSDEIIWIVTDTAWHPMPEVWDIVTKDYPGIKFYYLAEECGCGVFINSDPTGIYFPEEYRIYNDKEGYSDYANDTDSLLAMIAEMVGVEKFESVEELDKFLEEYNEERDEGLYYHKFSEPN